MAAAISSASLSARRAWIEIGNSVASNFKHTVALRKESVDRNNAMQIVVVIMHAVALRKESVDRNNSATSTPSPCRSSLSARRAWIEIVTA